MFDSPRSCGMQCKLTAWGSVAIEGAERQSGGELCSRFTDSAVAAVMAPSVKRVAKKKSSIGN